MKEWRLILSGAGTGPWNLALDEAIFRFVRDGAHAPTLRLYEWSAPTLSIGYAQDRGRDVDEAACRELGIEVLRRITGGRAVLHDREVTYAVAAPAGEPGFGSGLETAYGAIASGLAAGLRLLGLDPAPGPGGAAPASRHPACFAALARHELGIGGRKLVGSAQRREGGAFLQHGSILLASHEALLARVLRRSPPRGAGGGMTGLADFLEPLPPRERIVAAIAAGCESAWGIRLRSATPSRHETLLARELETARYRTEGWNAGIPRRMPPAPISR
jgi:lipoate-protein ligase A